MKKIFIIFLFIVSTAHADRDIIGHINSEAPVSSWTAAKRQAMLDDFVAYFNYQTEIDDGAGGMIPNPETKKEFANRMIEERIKNCVQSVRKDRAVDGIIIENLDLDN